MGGQTDDGFARQVAAIRDGQHLGKSTTLVALFDYLVRTSLEGRSPKEVEIADAVFHRDGFATMQDASVRVYVFRLRKKLDDYYAGPGADQKARLVLQKGDYRLRLETSAPDAPGQGPVTPPSGRRVPVAALAGGAALGAAVTALLLWATLIRPDLPERDLQAVRDSAVWAPTVAPDKSIAVVVGDYYMFGEQDHGGRPRRLIREFDINSRYDLDDHVMRHPELYGRYFDMGLRYYPIGVATALRDIMPVLRTPGRRVHPVRVVPASEITPDMFRISNIVYIGNLSGLGALRNAVFNGSRYRIGRSFGELVDKRTGRVFAATIGPPSPTQQVDYGYVSRFNGPNGNTILIIAGTRDAAVMQAADYASRRDMVEAMESGAGKGAAFEALFRVDTVGGQNVGGRMLAISPLDGAAIWRATPPQAFPVEAARSEPQAK